MCTSRAQNVVRRDRFGKIWRTLWLGKYAPEQDLVKRGYVVSIERTITYKLLSLQKLVGEKLSRPNRTSLWVWHLCKGRSLWEADKLFPAIASDNVKQTRDGPVKVVSSCRCRRLATRTPAICKVKNTCTVLHVSKRNCRVKRVRIFFMESIFKKEVKKTKTKAVPKSLPRTAVTTVILVWSFRVTFGKTCGYQM